MGVLTTILELIGLTLVALGAAMVYPPAGVIVAGVELVVVGVANAPRPAAGEDAG